MSIRIALVLAGGAVRDPGPPRPASDSLVAGSQSRLVRFAAFVPDLRPYVDLFVADLRAVFAAVFAAGLRAVFATAFVFFFFAGLLRRFVAERDAALVFGRLTVALGPTRLVFFVLGLRPRVSGASSSSTYSSS
jgi:hypothetical protein